MDNRPFNVFSAPRGLRSGLSGSPSYGSGGAPAGRLVWLFVAFAIPLAAVAARLAQLQCFLADNYVAAFETTTESEEAIPSTDGRIYAADGRVLVEDVERYNISVHYRWIENPPNEHWLTRQALAGLSRSERRNRERVAAEKKRILTLRDALWTRLAELSGVSPQVLAERRASIQERVERIAIRLAEKQAAREAEVSDEPARFDLTGSLLCRIWTQLAAALTTPPRREADDPIVAREALDYHPLIQDVALDVRAQIEAHPRLFPGVRVGCLSRRVYYDSSFAPHVVGARVPATAAELANVAPAIEGDKGPPVAVASSDDSTADPLDYRPGDRIGRTGVEAGYDSHLHGLRGLRRITRNRCGEIIREETIRSPRPGGSVELTLSTPVERKMEQLLDAALKPQPAGSPPAAGASTPSGGAVVALDVQSGAVFVLASAPRFDFGSTGIPDVSTWQGVSDDPRRPLFHRAIQSALPPGSVFKVLSAVALLQSRKLDPDAKFECQGYLDRPDRFRCLIYAQQKVGHGPVDLSEALSRSCNVYFFQVADRIGPQPLVEWAGRFGIGCQTGVDLPFEKTGHLPEPVAGRWHPGDTRALAVGQSSLTVTPLQIARVMAAIANGGDLVTPFVARRSGPKLADEETASSLSRRMPIPGLADGTLARIRAALEKTVSDPSGTGYSTVRMKEISIAGKSGTAQAGKGQADHAWFAGYAPADNPRVAFTVVLEHAGSGSKAAGPLARQLVEALLADGVLQPERVTLRK
jgi:penicillin-binding protein 2